MSKTVKIRMFKIDGNYYDDDSKRGTFYEDLTDWEEVEESEYNTLLMLVQQENNSLAKKATYDNYSGRYCIIKKEEVKEILPKAIKHYKNLADKANENRKKKDEAAVKRKATAEKNKKKKELAQLAELQNKYKDVR